MHSQWPTAVCERESLYTMCAICVRLPLFRRSVQRINVIQMLYRTRISFILLFLISIRYFLNYLCIILIFIHLNVPIFSLVISISLWITDRFLVLWSGREIWKIRGFALVSWIQPHFAYRHDFTVFIGIHNHFDVIVDQWESMGHTKLNEVLRRSEFI